MTNRAARRAPGALAKGHTIPAPPKPEWQHWWNPQHRRWYLHDQRVINYITQLADPTNTQPDD